MSPSPAQARRAVLAIAFLLPALRLAPLAAGPFLASPEEVFLGHAHLGLDFPAYASFLEQARESSALRMRNEFTLAPQDGRYLLLGHWAIGRLAALLRLPVAPVWHGAQYVLGVGVLLLVWRFVGLFFAEPGPRLAAFLLGTTSAGFAWIPRAAGVGDTGPWRFAHANIGWSAFGMLCNPLWLLAFALVLGALTALVRAERERRVVPLLAAGAAVALLPLVHPYTMVGLGAVLAVAFTGETLALLRGRAERRFAAASLLAVAAFGVVDVGLASWQRQDEVYRLTAARALADAEAVPLWLWAVGFGVLLPAGLAGVAGLLRDERFSGRLVGAWIVAVTATALVPALSPARHLYLLPVPLAIAAVRAFEGLRPRLPRALSSRRAIAVTLGLLAVGNLVTVVDSVRDLRARPGYFLTRDEAEAMAALREHERGGVLSHGAAGIFVPWLARKPVFSAHWFLSLVHDPRTGVPAVHEMMLFYARRRGDAELAWRADLLRQNGVRYVWYGPVERRLGHGAGLDAGLGLRRVIDTGTVQVYEVPESLR